MRTATIMDFKKGATLYRHGFEYRLIHRIPGDNTVWLASSVVDSVTSTVGIAAVDASMYEVDK